MCSNWVCPWLERGGRCTRNRWWYLGRAWGTVADIPFFPWMVPRNSELATRALIGGLKPGDGRGRTACPEGARSRSGQCGWRRRRPGRVCKAPFPASLELLYSFPFKAPLASGSATHSAHRILLLVTPCRNKRATRLFRNATPSVRTSLQRQQPGPSALHYQSFSASLQRLASSSRGAGSSFGSPDTAVADSRDRHSLFRVVAPNAT